MNYSVDHCEPFDQKRENIWMKIEHIGRYLFAADFLQGKTKILDVACAEGFGSAMLAEKGFAVFGADINPSYVAVASGRSNGNFIQLDFETERFPEAFADADAVVCFETIEHLEDCRFFLKNIYECLKPNGFLLLSFPNAAYEKLDENGSNYDIYHKRIYSKAEVEKIARDIGFFFRDELGQSLCNTLCTANANATHNKGIAQNDIDALFRYDKESLMILTQMIGYPDHNDVDRSYSYIWVLQK